MKEQELIPHLFRKEFSKITAVLCKFFGLEHIQTAEDITSETFIAALETWPRNGIPENPTGWLYAVAKNKARNLLNRRQTFRNNVSPEIQYSNNSRVEMELEISEKNILDSQLQMIFAICHPAIPVESQIGLALRILCGFGIDEIANAFLTNKETINKRLYRAKKTIRDEKIEMELPPSNEINQRLDAVLTTLYLLFNEGYYSESSDMVLRKDLCLEAMRLAYLLVENEETSTPDVLALLALICFHSSRFEARKNRHGEIVLYEDQDTSLWNEELIAKGAYYLNRASGGEQVSKYHLEAGIAWWHTMKADTENKWSNILQLYNQLVKIDDSPIVALNRIFALSKVYGKHTAIEEAETLKLENNRYYQTLLGVLYRDVDAQKAKNHLLQALSLTQNEAERKTIQKQLESL